MKTIDGKTSAGMHEKQATCRVAMHGAMLALALFSVIVGLPTRAIAQTGAGTAGNNVAAPDFALRSLDGANLRLSEFHGQVVVLGFWARWCGDCRQAMQALNGLHGKYEKAGLVTLGINVDDSAKEAAAMARNLGLSFPVLLDERKTASSLFNLASMPLIVLIDREGRQRYKHTRFELGDEAHLGDELRMLLNE